MAVQPAFCMMGDGQYKLPPLFLYWKDNPRGARGIQTPRPILHLFFSDKSASKTVNFISAVKSK